MRIEVRVDALKIYAGDMRWEGAEDTMRAESRRLLSCLQGRQYLVVESHQDELGIFYDLMIDPAIMLPNALGIQQRYRHCQIPAEYVTVIRSGFWRAS